MPRCAHSPVECSACRIARRKAERAAEQSVPPVDMVAQLERAKAAQAARVAQADLVAGVRRASAMYDRAQEWPRCGQRWPMDAAERAADALIRDHGAMIESVGFSR